MRAEPTELASQAANETMWELSDVFTLQNIAGYRKNLRDMVQDYEHIPACVATTTNGQSRLRRSVKYTYTIQIL